MIDRERIVGGLIGLAVGDALGVPVEFEPRDRRREDPLTGMRGGGAHHQPPGTWSDDTGLTFCTVETILDAYSVERLGISFARWLTEGRWTPRGEVFDVGGTTRAGILRIIEGVSPAASGSPHECDNGNGSLMRILPVVMAFSRRSIPLMLERVHEASAVTHAHPRSLMGCGLYGLICRNLLFRRGPLSAYRYAMEDGQRLYVQDPWRGEHRAYRLILRGTLADVGESQIHSSGYVVQTLEAATWSLLTTRNYRECVLRAVNLGEDADTVGAVAGGLAGVAYGLKSIPREWIDALSRRDELLAWAERFATAVTA